MIVEHLGENTEDGGLIFVDRTFNVNVEQNGLCLTSGCFIYEHKSGRVIRKFRAESLHGLHSVYRAVLQNKGKHFQKVRFTTSEETGNPYSGVISRLRETVTVMVEETYKVLFELLRDNIFAHFAFGGSILLIDFNNTVYLTVDVICKHGLNFHYTVASLHHIECAIIRIRR